MKWSHPVWSFRMWFYGTMIDKAQKTADELGLTLDTLAVTPSGQLSMFIVDGDHETRVISRRFGRVRSVRKALKRYAATTRRHTSRTKRRALAL